MCIVSFVGDNFNNQLPIKHPWVIPNSPPWRDSLAGINGPSQYEFDQLKQEVEALKELLKAAKIYDEATNQKDCEMEEKVALLRRVAEMVGVDLSEIFPRAQ